MKLISWNVAGRVKKQPLQLEAVLGEEPYLLALQEVTVKTARMWKAGLSEAGYEHILSSFDISEAPEKMIGGRGRALLVASRYPLTVLDQTGLEMPWKERLLSVLVQYPHLDFELHNAYIPPGSSHGWLKIETFEGIYNYLAHESGTPRILCGDFNSPKQELTDGRTVLWGQRLTKKGTIKTPKDPRWPRGEGLVIRGLADYDLEDVYRSLNGWAAEDYSWVVKRKGKVVSWRRFDHIFASRMLGAISCTYLHAFREGGLSDHSAVVAVFSLNGDYDKSKALPGLKTPAEGRHMSEEISKQSYVDEIVREVSSLANQREDIRSTDPRESHRTAFLAGWTRAAQGELFSTVIEKKTHANMGNLFGWIYGEQSREFKLATWYHYLDSTNYEDK